LFTAFFDATVSVAVAGLFLWGGFDVFEVALGAPVGDLVFSVILFLDVLVMMGDFDCVCGVAIFGNFFGDVEVIFGFLVVSKFFSCQGKERERMNAIMYIMYVSHAN
jgi:hypothetical protein